MARASTPKSPEVAAFKLTDSSAARLAALSGVEAEALRGLTIADVASKFAFRIDPALLFFRRICGRW